MSSKNIKEPLQNIPLETTTLGRKSPKQEVLGWSRKKVAVASTFFTLLAIVILVIEGYLILLVESSSKSNGIVAPEASYSLVEQTSEPDIMPPSDGD